MSDVYQDPEFDGWARGIRGIGSMIMQQPMIRARQAEMAQQAELRRYQAEHLGAETRNLNEKTRGAEFQNDAIAHLADVANLFETTPDGGVFLSGKNVGQLASKLLMATGGKSGADTINKLMGGSNITTGEPDKMSIGNLLLHGAGGMGPNFSPTMDRADDVAQRNSDNKIVESLMKPGGQQVTPSEISIQLRDYSARIRDIDREFNRLAKDESMDQAIRVRRMRSLTEDRNRYDAEYKRLANWRSVPQETPTKRISDLTLPPESQSSMEDENYSSASAGPSQSFKSPDEVKSAFHGGKIDKATAARILREQFNFK